MNASELQALLPPFNAREEIIVPEQESRDIIREVLDAHKQFAWQYDYIAPIFSQYTGNDLCHVLYDFCIKYLPYKAESDEYQSTRSPAGIIAMRQIMRSDCKHYSGFIAGVLDAVGRYTGKLYDWNYRFAGYNPDQEIDHVYTVCVLDTGEEIWLDPAPIWNSFLGSYTKRSYNDRYVIPKKSIDKYVQPMLVRLSGASMGDASTEALNAVEPGLGDAVNQSISTLPDGDIKDFLQSFMKDPGKAIITLIKGRTYTSGDYSVGEMYMRNILGMSNVQRWEQVPDGYVPQAWLFFSCAMGVRIRTNTDFDALCGYANTRDERARNYLSRNPEETSDISLEAATRAAYMFGEPGYDGLFSIWQNRDKRWSMSTFSVLPYIYPIPGAAQNENFTGMHPVLGKQFVNGYPIDYVGPRYISQVNHNIQPGTDTSTPAQPGSSAGTPAGTPSGGNPPPPAATQNAMLPILLLGAVGIGIAASGKKRSKSVHGPNAALKWGGLALLVFLGYEMYQKSTPAYKRQYLLKYANAMVDPARRTLWTGAINLMSDSEISALYNYVCNFSLKGVPAPVDVLVANIALYKKYGVPDFPEVMSMNLGTLVNAVLPTAVDTTKTITVDMTVPGGGTVPGIQMNTDGGVVLVPLQTGGGAQPIFVPDASPPIYAGGGGGVSAYDGTSSYDPIYNNPTDSYQQVQA